MTKATIARRVFSVALASFLLGGALGGCQESQRRNLGTGPQAYPVAIVNNERITLEEFLDNSQLFLTRWHRFIQNDPEKKKTIREILLANMIDEKLLDQEARRRGIEIQEPAVDSKILRLTSPWREEELARAARRANTTLEQWRAEFHRQMVHEELIRREVVAKIRVTQRELRAYYERNREQFVQPEQVRVRHIAVGSRSVYNRVTRLLKRRRDFVKLVRKYSITPDRLADGDLGYVQRGVLPLEMDKAIFSMKRVGSTSSSRNPVRTQIGYHIFRLEDRRPRADLSFRAAIPLIKKTLVRRKQTRAFKKWMRQLREAATIKIDRKLMLAATG